MSDRGQARGTAGLRDGSGHADQVRVLFDSKAAGWPGKYATDGRLAGRLAQFADAVRDLTPAGGRVLDLGCGSGELARRLAAAGYQVTGCDIAPEMLRQASAADGGRAVRWERLEPGWRRLPTGDASLDAMVAASVLEYVPDPLSVLRECGRVLRPGGTLLCTVPDQTHPVRWLERPLRLAARTPAARAAGDVWPRLGRYLTYLRISRQRQPVRWWRQAAAQAGLRLAPPAGRRAQRGPLRMLCFSRSADTWPAETRPARAEPGGAPGLGYNDTIGGLQ
jgi:SAM-dependent methyltransferase